MDEVEFTASPRPTCPRWWWRLEEGRCRRGGDERAALPGPPARGHAARHDRPRGVRRLYHIRPVVRLSAEGSAPSAGRGSRLDLAATRWRCRAALRGVEPQQRWRTYATLLLDVAARCGVQRLVSLGAVLEAVPHTRPPQVTGSSTDPAWHARFEACGIRTRRSRYEGPTGISTVVMDAARDGAWRVHRAGQAPHYLGNATNPAVSRALLIAVAHLLDLELDVTLEAAVRAFAPNVTRPWRKTPPSRPMSGN